MLCDRGDTAENPETPGDWPSISLIIAAHNEEGVIAEKLRNTLRIDYPADRLEVVVASDASDDRTDRIVRGFAGSGMRLVRVEGRRGKTSAQNAAVKETTNEIIVFSDANAMYDKDALKKLAKHFSDEGVGCVEGRRLDFDAECAATARHELTYRDYESWIKRLESRVASCTGATGPIYGVRRSCYIELPAEAISDLMEPIMIMHVHGKRQVFEPGAISRETVLAEMSNEFQRKVRIITRCLNSITSVPGLLNPFSGGVFALQIWSHRLLRWMLPLFALLVLAGTLTLSHRPLFLLALQAQLAFLLAVLLGFLLDCRNLGPSILRLPYYVFTVNAAALLGLLNWVRGKNILVWDPDRGNS